jgi:hypothetical protein
MQNLSQQCLDDAWQIMARGDGNGMARGKLNLLLFAARMKMGGHENGDEREDWYFRDLSQGNRLAVEAADIKISKFERAKYASDLCANIGFDIQKDFKGLKRGLAFATRGDLISENSEVRSRAATMLDRYLLPFCEDVLAITALNKLDVVTINGLAGVDARILELRCTERPERIIAKEWSAAFGVSIAMWYEAGFGEFLETAALTPRQFAMITNAPSRPAKNGIKWTRSVTPLMHK